MQIIKTVSFSLLLCAAAMQPVSAGVVPNSIHFNETPAKTIIIKHPAANNSATFFSSGTVFQFEVFKAGTPEQVQGIIQSLSKNDNVLNANAGKPTGDYQAISLTLKSAKDKAWFISLFKNAGLNNIKINNNPVVEVEKM